MAEIISNSGPLVKEREKNASDKTGLQILATYRLKDPPLSRNLNL